VALFVVVGYAIALSGDPAATSADTSAIDVVDSLRATWLTDVAEGVTVLGSTWLTSLVAIAAGAALALRRRWMEVGVLVAAMVIAHIAVPVLKEVVDRPRPEGSLVDTTGDSYPSGHAAYAVIYTWLALTITVRVRPGLTYTSTVIVVGVLLTAAVGLSRVYLGAHYFSDVSGGWGLGFSAFAACAAIALLITHRGSLRQNASGGDR
jgi:membrane-associated phospholipid phosphatase